MNLKHSSPTGFRRVLRWVPPLCLGLVQAGAWGALYSSGLTGVVGWLVLLSLIPFLGAGAVLSCGLYATWRRRFSWPVGATLFLGLLALWPGAWSFGLGQITYPASAATTAPAATVRLPSDQALRVVWGGDRLATNRHAFTPDQRWGYDLVIEPYFSGSSKLADCGCWGSRVVAPSNNSRKPLGNFVALELETKTFLIIAHLQPGSIAVMPGDSVSEGQTIGRCGNSGNTSEPHIHIHHQRQDPKKFPVNFGEGLPLFFRDHDGPPMPEGGVEVEAGRAHARGAVVKHVGDRRPRPESGPP